MPQVQVLPEVADFGTHLMKVLGDVGDTASKSIAAKRLQNKQMTQYQQILEQQRNEESKRKTQFQLGTYLQKLYEMKPQSDEAMTGLFQSAYDNIQSGMDIPTAVNAAVKGSKPAKTEEPTMWGRIFGSKSSEPAQPIPQRPSDVVMPEEAAPKADLSQDELRARYAKMPGKTHEQKIKNLHKTLTAEGYSVKDI